MVFEINLNINEYVSCELTEHGDAMIRRRGYYPKYKNGGFLEIQLWELMQHLGDAIFNGSEQSIVGNRITIVGHTASQPH